MENEIKVCKYCGKVDIKDDHEDNCSYEAGRARVESEDNLWK